MLIDANIELEGVVPRLEKGPTLVIYKEKLFST